jgi:hypothetical protein
MHELIKKNDFPCNVSLNLYVCVCVSAMSLGKILHKSLLINLVTQFQM